jgi:hypothetical protein
MSRVEVPRKFESAIGMGSRLVAIVLLGLPMSALGKSSTLAQQVEIAPEIVERMAKEKEVRRTCKVQICNAFAKPISGSPITSEVTKTWTQPEITSKVVGESYIWQYGHTQYTVKLSLERDVIAKAMADGGSVKFLEHLFICNVDDKDATKGKAFTVTLTFTPSITFEKGQAKSVTMDPVKTKGSTLASAAVSSLMTVDCYLRVDKVSGIVSRAAANEINDFLYSKCEEDGVDIARK